MRALSDVLWHERDLLELLAHRLDVEQVLLETGRTKRIALAARETETALDENRTAELARTAEAEAAAVALDLPPHASLGELAEAAPPPWDDILIEHREALRELVEEITALTEAQADGSPEEEAQPDSTSEDADESFLDSLRDSLETRVDAASDTGPTDAEDSSLPDADELSPADVDEFALADVELTDAVIELQLQDITSTAGQARGHVLQQGLVDFLR